MAHGIHLVRYFERVLHIISCTSVFLWSQSFGIMQLQQGHCSLLSLYEAKDTFIKSQSNFLIQHLQ